MYIIFSLTAHVCLFWQWHRSSCRSLCSGSRWDFCVFIKLLIIIDTLHRVSVRSRLYVKNTLMLQRTWMLCLYVRSCSCHNACEYHIRIFACVIIRNSNLEGISCSWETFSFFVTGFELNRPDLKRIRFRQIKVF